jgi:hypothetical protein
MFALRPATRLGSRAFHASALRAADKSALEVSLRDGLKTAMKAKDKPAVTVLKVSRAINPINPINPPPTPPA